MSSSLFQPPSKKLKQHDSYDDMVKFSASWKKYPVLYDDAVRNSKFSENFKGTGKFIRDCYEAMANKLGMTCEDVKKRHIKYVDAVTKGLGQLKHDLDHGTTKYPIPAIHKLRIFHWLWPHSKNYDKDSMEDVSFDDYMECAVTVEVRRQICEKKDSTAAMETLRKVRELNEAKEMKKLNLNCGQECNVEQSWDDSSVLCDIDSVEIVMAATSICEYLPPSKDPTFHYAKAGYVMFEAVSVEDAAIQGKGVRKHSDGTLFSTLKASGSAALKCQQALRRAQNSQQLFYDSCATVIGRQQLPFCDDKDEHAMIELNAEVLQGFSAYKQTVHSAVTAASTYVDEYYALRDAAKMTPLLSPPSMQRKQKIIADIEYLQRLRDKSKCFSSNSWICVLLNQL